MPDTTTGQEQSAAGVRVAAGLELAIHEHRIAPGQKLTEEELCGIFGVSRTVVRSALQSLAHAGLVQMERNRGAFVAQPTRREAREVFEARRMLEPAMAAKAALAATAEDGARMKAHLRDEDAAMAGGNTGRALHLSGQFHVMIARIAGQETVLSMIEALVARSSLVIALYRQRASALCENCAHSALAEAIVAGEATAASDLMLAHLEDLEGALALDGPASPSLSLREALVGTA